ncbi:MAG TPA: hypothetical protein VFZ66_11140 [Herpetosiphonaceae bacterium]
MHQFDEEEWKHLSIMNDEDIDYSVVPEPILEKLALGNELYIANSALVELWMRETLSAAPIAAEILVTGHSDRYLQATALRVLFERDRSTALRYMQEQAPTCDLYTLYKMMQLLTEEDGLSSSNKASLIPSILERLKILESEETNEDIDFIDLEVKEAFFQKYNS